MNRRLMMAQQSKGFELVYNSSSGTLPTEQGWKFNYWIYGNNIGGTQSMGENLLNVNVWHDYEHCRYSIADKPTAQNCEFSVTVDNVSGLIVSSKVGFLLTNGKKAIMIVFYPNDSGWLVLSNKGHSFTSVKYQQRFGTKTNFTLKARLENGAVSVWLDDRLLTTITDLYDLSEIYTGKTHTDAGNPWYSGGTYLFYGIENTISFAIRGTYYVSQLSYKEW